MNNKLEKYYDYIVTILVNETELIDTHEKSLNDRDWECLDRFFIIARWLKPGGGCFNSFFKVSNLKRLEVEIILEERFGTREEDFPIIWDKYKDEIIKIISNF